MKGDFATKALLSTFGLCAVLMFFGANGQVFALLLFFWAGIPLTIVVTISLWRNPRPKPISANQAIDSGEAPQSAKTLSYVKFFVGLALFAIGVAIFVSNIAIRGPASVLAIFGIPFMVVAFLPLVDGLRALKAAGEKTIFKFFDPKVMIVLGVVTALSPILLAARSGWPQSSQDHIDLRNYLLLAWVVGSLPLVYGVVKLIQSARGAIAAKAAETRTSVILIYAGLNFAAWSWGIFDTVQTLQPFQDTQSLWLAGYLALGSIILLVVGFYRTRASTSDKSVGATKARKQTK